MLQCCFWLTNEARSNSSAAEFHHEYFDCWSLPDLWKDRLNLSLLSHRFRMVMVRPFAAVPTRFVCDFSSRNRTVPFKNFSTSWKRRITKKTTKKNKTAVVSFFSSIVRPRRQTKSYRRINTARWHWMATLPRRFFYDRAPIIVVPSDVFFLHSGKKINKNNRKRSRPAINDLQLFFPRSRCQRVPDWPPESRWSNEGLQLGAGEGGGPPIRIQKWNTKPGLH